MAIAFDACSKATGNNVATLNCSHIIGGGSNRMLIVGVVVRCTTAPYINYCRYNGVGMNYLQYYSIQSGNDTLTIQIWCMYGASLPSSGTYNISVNCDRSINEGFMIFGVSHTGMMPQNPVFNLGKSGTGTAISYTWASALQANERIVCVGGTALAQTPTVSGANAIVINDGSTYCNGNVGSVGGILMRDQPVYNGDSDTFGFDVASSAQYCFLYSEFLPASIVYVPSGRRATMSAGTCAPKTAKASTGSRATSGSGTLIPKESKALTGSSIASGSGVVRPQESKKLTGSSIPSGSGSVYPKVSKGLTGSASASGSGSLGVQSDIALTGEEITSDQGSPSPSQSVSLTGGNIPASAGSVAPSLGVTLDGEKLQSTTGYLQGIVNIINMPHGLILDYTDTPADNPVRIKILGSVYALYLITPTDDHAGCIRMKLDGTVYALVQAGGSMFHMMMMEKVTVPKSKLSKIPAVPDGG